MGARWMDGWMDGWSWRTSCVRSGFAALFSCVPACGIWVVVRGGVVAVWLRNGQAINHSVIALCWWLAASWCLIVLALASGVKPALSNSIRCTAHNTNTHTHTRTAVCGSRRNNVNDIKRLKIVVRSLVCRPRSPTTPCVHRIGDTRQGLA